MTFDSLTKALEGWFDTPLAELPSPQRNRVEAASFRRRWDCMNADQRRSVAGQLDFQNDPATEEEREQIWKEACELHRIEQEILKLERMSPPMPLEMESKHRQLDELRRQLKELTPKKENSPYGSYRTSTPVTSHKIVATFALPRPDNEDWWDRRMRDAKRYGLVDSRASRGRKRQPSLWYPDRVAAWLVDKNHMKSDLASRILRDHFPDCVEEANWLALPDG